MKFLIRQRLSRGISSHFMEIQRSQCLIGRGSADIGLREDKCSRQHALIFLKGSSLRVTDLESTNGTQLNGRGLRTEKALKVGDEIRIGDCLITLVEFEAHASVIDGRWHEWKSEGAKLRLVRGDAKKPDSSQTWRKAA